MKIVCGSCQAKYSIADEKVAGKVFKIRCKRCSEVIVVRGDQDGAVETEAAANPGAAYDTGADAIWHVVINGEQAGPYSPSQLGEMLTSGHVDWEAYVWCEGFDNWAAMRDVPDLVAAITGQGQPQQQAQPAAAYAAQPSMGADPFADDGNAGGGLFAEPAPAMSSSRGGGNLFGGGGHDSPFDGGGQVVASSPGPRVSAEQAMTGARNENSVLFSLKNLQALATGGSTPGNAGAGVAQMGPGNRAGFAGGDGSGLIDIRALASATGVGDSKREETEKDALLSLGSAQTGAFGALGSPMLAPASADDDSGKKGMMIAIFGGFALLAIAGVAVAVIMRPQPQAATPMVAPAAPPPVAAVAVAANPTPAEPTEAPSEGEIAAKRAAEAAAAPASSEKREGSARSGSGKRREDSSDKAPAAAEEKAEPAAAKAPEKPKGGSSSIDDLLNGAIGGGSTAKPAAKKEAAPAASNLPEKPSRDDVISAMNGVKDAVSACGKGQTGVAFANVNVAGKTGRVTSAEITGITGEAGSCIARAVRKASFPKFQSESFQVKYPFRLQ